MSITADTLAKARSLRVVLDKTVDATTRDLVKAWSAAWHEIADEWASAVDELVQLGDGDWPTQTQVLRAKRAQKAMQAAREALDDLAKTSGVRILRDVSQLAEDTDLWEQRLALSQLPKHGVTVDWSRLDSKALGAIVKRTTQQVESLLRPLPAVQAAVMRQTLIRGIAVGDNPRQAAALMLQRVGGVFDGGRFRAENIARTEMLDSARAAAKAARLANADVLSGWTWHCTFDSRTCFPAGTLITTSRGDVAIEQVREGDTVMSHTGKWRRAYSPMSRDYSGRMVTVTAGGLSVTSTADHPFLIERKGELQWMEAQHIIRGDHVLSDAEGSLNGIDHRLSKVAVEGRGHQPQNSEPTRLHEDVLASVPVLDAVVPVGLVNLDHEGTGADEEVHGPGPARNGVLLVEWFTQNFKRLSYIGLGLRLSRVAPVAPHGAEALSVRWHDARTPSADGAFQNLRRSPAFLRTVLKATTLRGEHRPAARARRVLDVCARTVDAAVAVTVRTAGRGAEQLVAPNAGLGYSPTLRGAGAGAMPRRSHPAGGEGRPARRALLGYGRNSLLAASRVGVLALMGGVARLRAEAPGALADPRRWDLEMGAASLTSPLHRLMVSGVSTHIQTTRRVYNFEVEEDHSYLANGIAVHNCPACLAQHGEVFPVDQFGPEGHQQCRCTAVPITRSWRELGFDIDEPASLQQDAEQWFWGQPATTQTQIMGPERLRRLQSGDLKWEDLAVRRENPGWRPSWTVAPLQQAS